MKTVVDTARAWVYISLVETTKPLGLPKFLTDSEVEEVRRLYRAGARTTDIAALFGVHRSTVSRIARGLRRVEPLEREVSE